MQKKTIYLLVTAITTGLLYIIFSNLVKDTALIWYETRIFGLFAYVCLLITLLLGEIRMVYPNRGEFWLFKYHKPIAVFSVYLAALHGLSAVIDEYKWGKGLSFVQYLGFSYSDKWMLWLSFGTIAFYLLVLVSATSATKAISKLGYKNWKIVHYLSYLCFLIAYLHAINLGTDIKTSIYSPFVSVFVHATFVLCSAIFFTRIMHSMVKFDNKVDVAFCAVFFLFVIAGAVLLYTEATHYEDRISSMNKEAVDLSANVTKYTHINSLLSNQTDTLLKQLQVIRNG